MGKEGGVAGGFYVGGYDLSGDVGVLDRVGSPRATKDVPGISQSAYQRLLLLGHGEIAFMAFFNDATGQAHPALSALPTTTTHVLYAQGQAIGDVCAMLVALQVNYDPVRNEDRSLDFRIEAVSTAGVALEWGVMLSAADDTHSSATSSSSLDNGASSSDGAAAVLELIDISSGTPTVVVEDSANDSTFATLISFTAVADGGEPTSERKTVSGTVDRYVRVTTTGTFTNAKFAVGIRRGESTDDVAYA